MLLSHIHALTLKKKVLIAKKSVKLLLLISWFLKERARKNQTPVAQTASISPLVTGAEPRIGLSPEPDIYGIATCSSKALPIPCPSVLVTPNILIWFNVHPVNTSPAGGGVVNTLTFTGNSHPVSGASAAPIRMQNQPVHALHAGILISRFALARDSS